MDEAALDVGVGGEATLKCGGVDGGAGSGGGGLGGGADEESEGKVIGRESGGVEDSVVEEEGEVGGGALGVRPDKGIEGEEGRGVGGVGEEVVGVGEEVGEGEGQGGDELGEEGRVVEMTINEEVGVDLVNLGEGGGGVQKGKWAMSRYHVSQGDHIARCME